jgi:hypothetical protein
MPNLIGQDIVSKPIEFYNTYYVGDDWQYGGYNDFLKEMKVNINNIKIIHIYIFSMISEVNKPIVDNIYKLESWDSNVISSVKSKIVTYVCIHFQFVTARYFWLFCSSNFFYTFYQREHTWNLSPLMWPYNAPGEHDSTNLILCYVLNIQCKSEISWLNCSYNKDFLKDFFLHNHIYMHIVDPSSPQEP